MVDIDRTKSLGRLRDFVGVDTTLKQNGDRWVGLCPFHKEKTPSFSVFIGDDGYERYFCFGCNASGDVLDYVTEKRGVDFKGAAEIITADGGDTRPSRKVAKPHDPYKGITPISPVPGGVPAIKPDRRVKVWNPKRERYTNYTPHAVHPYKTAEGLHGYVLRMEMDDGRKITPQVMWCKREEIEGEWSHYTFPKPRAPYGIERLKKQKQVVVVEGEKTADAARKLLGTVVVSWVGGTSQVEHTDWVPLADHNVVIIPDADEPGVAAAGKIAKLLHQAGAKKIRIVDTSGQSKGWDLADALADDWSRKKTLEWLKKRATEWVPPTPPKAEPSNVAVTSDESWREGMMYNADGGPKSKSPSNYILFLRFHPDLAGVFMFNKFSLEITLVKCPPWEDKTKFTPRPLADEDITFCRAAFDRFGMAPSADSMRKSIHAAASKNSVHPAREFFDNLKGKWDGTERLKNWLTYYLGVEPSDFASIIGRKWMIAAVRRVFQPGCKFDTMLILEGKQNIGKSLALRELATFNGVAYFTDDIGDIQRKEAAMTMHGVLIVELSELDALSKAEVSHIKAWITRQEDHYRAPYASVILRAPRQCVLAGTVNPEGGYLRDSTGARRFWPVWCTSVDLDAIKADREQLWAEAVNGHLGGEPLYLVNEEIAVANAAQNERYQDDIWSEDIDLFLINKKQISVRIIVRDVLAIPAERQNVTQEKRVVSHLINRGWKRVRGKTDMMSDQNSWVFISPEEQEKQEEKQEEKE